MCPECGGLRPGEAVWHISPETLKQCSCQPYYGEDPWKSPSWPAGPNEPWRSPSTPEDPWTSPYPDPIISPDEPWTFPGDPPAEDSLGGFIYTTPVQQPRTVVHFNGPHGYSVRLWRDAGTGAIAVSAAVATLGASDGGSTTRLMMPQNSADATRMAVAVYVEANPDALPVLADALEEDPSVVVDGLGLAWLCALLRFRGFVVGEPPDGPYMGVPVEPDRP